MTYQHGSSPQVESGSIRLSAAEPTPSRLQDQQHASKRDLSDPTFGDGNVARKWGLAGPIDDGAAANDDVFGIDRVESRRGSGFMPLRPCRTGSTERPPTTTPGYVDAA
jgi:hypothetical protein